MKGSTTGCPIDAKTRWLRISRLFQIRLSRLMVLIAIAAVFFSAWLFNRRIRKRPASLDDQSDCRVERL